MKTTLLKPIPISLGILCILIGFGWLQQHNINTLQPRIDYLEQQIVRMPAIAEKLQLEKDVLVVKKDKITLLNGIYTTTLIEVLIGLTLGGIAYAGYRNFKIGEEKLKIGQKNLNVAAERQVAERFSKAIEHLGSDKIDVRLGGIYSLEQIAVNAPDYHWTIVEILSAFIREKCSAEELKQNFPDSEVHPEGTLPHPPKIEKVKVDIQAALTVLGRRKLERDPPDRRIDLRKVNLAHLEIQEINLDNVDFRSANLSGADLMSANLSGVDLRNANLSGAELRNANLSGANLQSANLVSVNLMSANLMSADLRHADLMRANLFHVDLRSVNFRSANLRSADLRSANLSGAYLRSADLRSADLRSANLSGADLSDANLSGDDFTGIDLRNVNLNGANLMAADLSKCENLTPEQLEAAKTNKSTKLPDRLKSTILS